MHLRSNTAYRLAFALAGMAAFVIVWMNTAAGLIGVEDDDPANLLYVAALAIGFVGTLAARFRARGLSLAMVATALAVAAIGAIALKSPNTASSLQIVIVHGLFVASFAGAALLFRHAGREEFSARGFQTER